MNETTIRPSKWDRGFRFAVVFGQSLDKDYKTKSAAIKRAKDWARDYPDDDIKVIDRLNQTDGIKPSVVWSNLKPGCGPIEARNNDTIASRHI